MQQKNKQNGISVVSAIIASICILMYLTALVQAAVRTYISIEDRRIMAGREFYDLADLVTSAGVLGFMDEPFKEAVNDALVLSKTLEAVIITGRDNTFAFELEQGKWINQVNSLYRFKNRPDMVRDQLWQTLNIPGLRNGVIEARASAIDYTALTVILKETLFLVLMGLILSFLTLLFEALLGKPRIEERPVEAERPPKAQAAVETETVHFDQKTETAGPRGLYSPHGNICWEDYTMDRLESELHRCASYEQDLVLVKIEFKKPSEDRLYNLFADDVVHFFGTRDLVFESSRGITVIYPNVDLDTGFSKCEEFHRRMFDKYAKWFVTRTDLCMGLSSRAGRLIDAERLAFETDEALERALSDATSPIVAFKSDPEKYRVFIASQNRRRS